MKSCGHSALRTLIALVVTVMTMLVRPSSAAEITCLQRGPAEGYSAEQRARIAEAFPSGRVPTADTCLAVLIKGTITTGDSAKFAQLLRKSHPFLSRVLLWSSGGSLDEAIKIGRLIRKALVETTAPSDFSQLGTYPHFADPRPAKGWGSLLDGNHSICKGYDCHCASACFLIWVAGSERTGTSLGLHRPKSTSSTFAALPPDRASALYRQLLLDIGKYLTDMEVPQRFIEIMTDTSSKEIRWLTYDEATSIENVPSVAEWLTSNCGAMTKEQSDTHAVLLTKQRRTHQEQMLFELLNKKWNDLNTCKSSRIRKSQDAIGEIRD